MSHNLRNRTYRQNIGGRLLLAALLGRFARRLESFLRILDRRDLDRKNPGR